MPSSPELAGGVLRGRWNHSEACGVLGLCGGALYWRSSWPVCRLDAAGVWPVVATVLLVAQPSSIGRAGPTGVWARRSSRAMEGSWGLASIRRATTPGAPVAGQRMWTSTGSQASRQARPFRPTGSSSCGTRRGYQRRYRRLFTHRSARAKPAARLSLCGVGLTRSTVRSSMVTSASRRMAWSCSSDAGLPDFFAPRSSPGFPPRPMASC